VTEAEWLTAADPGPMLEFLDGKLSDRKLRLFACAWCRHSCPRLTAAAGPRGKGSWAEAAAWSLAECRGALDVAERFADGLASDAERAAAHATATDWAGGWMSYDLLLYYEAMAAATANAAPGRAAAFLPPGQPYLAGPKGQAFHAADRALQADILREVVGNPFRPVAVDSSWRTPAVVRLAQEIYDRRAFDRLPALAHALQEAGCRDRAVLSHCRMWQTRWRHSWPVQLVLGPGRSFRRHVRGCWLVDALLDRR
jgi:hypothetical protein